MDLAEIQNLLTQTKQNIEALCANYYQQTGLSILGTFEVYIPSQGAVEVRVKADSAVILSAQGNFIQFVQEQQTQAAA